MHREQHTKESPQHPTEFLDHKNWKRNYIQVNWKQNHDYGEKHRSRVQDWDVLNFNFSPKWHNPTLNQHDFLVYFNEIPRPRWTTLWRPYCERWKTPHNLEDESMPRYTKIALRPITEKFLPYLLWRCEYNPKRGRISADECGAMRPAQRGPVVPRPWRWSP